MFNRKSTFIVGAIVGLVVAATTANALEAGRYARLTFSGPVALPGVTLGSGTYTFELATPTTSGHVVRVWNRAQTVVFLGHTALTERPEGLPEGRQIQLGEPARDAAPPIMAWFPIGSAMGHRFIYTR
jgi:hypothetical protein